MSDHATPNIARGGKLGMSLASWLVVLAVLCWVGTLLALVPLPISILATLGAAGLQFQQHHRRSTA